MRVTRVFLNTDLRKSFDGLRLVAKRERTSEGSNVMFINRARTAFKLLSGDKYLVYYKNGNRRIPLDAIQYLPSHFGGSEFEMNQAIRTSVEKALERKRLG